jgi:hypothetical protein
VYARERHADGQWYAQPALRQRGGGIEKFKQPEAYSRALGEQLNRGSGSSACGGRIGGQGFNAGAICAGQQTHSRVAARERRMQLSQHLGEGKVFFGGGGHAHRERLNDGEIELARDQQ